MATRRNIIEDMSGIITSTQHLLSSKGTNYGRFELEDYDDKIELPLWKRLSECEKLFGRRENC